MFGARAESTTPQSKHSKVFRLSKTTRANNSSRCRSRRPLVLRRSDLMGVRIGKGLDGSELPPVVLYLRYRYAAADEHELVRGQAHPRADSRRRLCARGRGRGDRALLSLDSQKTRQLDA